MKLSIEDKKIIAANASFIDERIAGSVIPAGTNKKNITVKNGGNKNDGNNAKIKKDGKSRTFPEPESELIKRWAKLTSNNSDNIGFKRRLKLARKSLDQINALIGPIVWNDEKTLPDWISTLEDFFGILPASYDKIMEALPAQTLSGPCDEPFQHTWSPWLLLCHKIFKRAAGKSRNLLSIKAEISWLRYILNLLNKKFGHCLNSAFDLLRFNDFNFFKIQAADSFAGDSKTLYDKFSRGMLEGGWLDFLKRYPVAARLISILCRQQALYFSEALKNYEKDAGKIGDTFNGGINPGLITGLKAGLSDLHNGGKSVIKFEFENGPSVYYKPRSAKIDALWSGILNWLSSKTSAIKFKTPLCADCRTHAWVEDIHAADLNKIEDASFFYYKAGAILALTYTLGGTDFHQENLIASGCEPVLIDLETLLNPLVKPFNYAGMSGEDINNYLCLEDDSVLRTCMLPLWIPVSKGVSRDYAALTPDDNACYSRREWLDINTDAMRREYRERKDNPSPNAPRFRTVPVNAVEYKDDIIKGFEDAYKLIMNNRDEFLSKNGPLKKISGARLRYLTRQSQIYADMIDRLLSPALMRDGAAFSLEIEGLAKPFLNGPPLKRIEAVWKIFEAEKRSLIILNIPLFEFSANGFSIFDSNGKISGDYFLKTAIEQAKRRVKKLSAGDVEFQSNLIDASLLCRYPNDKNKNTPIKKKNNETALKLPSISENDLVKTAETLAAKIAKRAVYKNGKPRWLTLKTDPASHNNYIGPVDLTLYEGISGIGLFLCAYEKLTGDKTCHELAVKCFYEIKELLNNKSAAAAAIESSAGYCAGMPGILCALYKSGNYILNDELITAAKNGIKLLNAKTLENDYALDIVGGAAGYALALARAYELTRVEIFKEAALEAVDYEASSYIPGYNNWPDFRHNRDLKPGEMAFMSGWCSGAPGTGLARLKMPHEFRDDSVKTDIENALSFTIDFKHFHDSRDHLCCGCAGRIDFLIEASIELNRPKLIEEAKKQFSFIVNRASLNGSYTLPVEESQSIFTPGLFTGLSGIGLTALRLIDSKLISSVLVPECL